MGLDMNAGWVSDEKKEDVVEFRWRKHAKLQEFMRQLWYQKLWIGPMNLVSSWISTISHLI